MSERTNEDWIAELRGDRGKETQRQAHEDLANYLHKIVYNYILKRQENLVALRSFSPDDLSELAKEFTQDTLFKLSINGFALLDRFRGDGRFTSWAASIVIREAGQEFRKPYWTRRGLAPGQRAQETDEEEMNSGHMADLSSLGPEQRVLNQEIGETLQDCINNLLAYRRKAFWECQIKSRPAQEVADDMGISRNAVYLLVYQAKRDLRKCLQRLGIGPDDLQLL